MRALFAGLAFLFVATHAEAQTPEALAAVERAAATGARIYAHDQAAWYGTDTMIADVGDPRREGYRGWITEDAPDGGVILTFVRPDGDALFAGYRVVYRDGAVRESARANAPLTEQQARLYRARQIAIAALEADGAPVCARNLNTVTLPRSERGADGADIDVYIMTPFESLQRLPLGGHYRIAIDGETGVARGVSRYMTSCFDMDVQPNTAAVMVSQVIGDTPTEMHVFVSLTARMRISVVSHSGTWTVDGSEIRYLSDTHN